MPVLLPFNGLNRNSVVIVDNCSGTPCGRFRSTDYRSWSSSPLLATDHPIQECCPKAKSCLKHTETISDDLELQVLPQMTVKVSR